MILAYKIVKKIDEKYFSCFAEYHYRTQYFRNIWSRSYKNLFHEGYHLCIFQHLEEAQKAYSLLKNFQSSHLSYEFWKVECREIIFHLPLVICTKKWTPGTIMAKYVRLYERML